MHTNKKKNLILSINKNTQCYARRLFTFHSFRYEAYSGVSITFFFDRKNMFSVFFFVIWGNDDINTCEFFFQLIGLLIKFMNSNNHTGKIKFNT